MGKSYFIKYWGDKYRLENQGYACPHPPGFTPLILYILYIHIYFLYIYDEIGDIGVEHKAKCNIILILRIINESMNIIVQVFIMNEKTYVIW